MASPPQPVADDVGNTTSKVFGRYSLRVVETLGQEPAPGWPGGGPVSFIQLLLSCQSSFLFPADSKRTRHRRTWEPWETPGHWLSAALSANCALRHLPLSWPLSILFHDHDWCPNHPPPLVPRSPYRHTLLAITLATPPSPANPGTPARLWDC